MTAPVTLSNEQLLQLLSALKSSDTRPDGNFAACKSRFTGGKDEDVEAFIEAINVFKSCTNVSDDNAVKGLGMLLDKHAATWWQGSKSGLTTWDETQRALRHAFGHGLAPHQVFQQLFAMKHSASEPADIFVAKARALLAKLPAAPVLHLTHQLDMVYGLLHKNLRRCLPRNSFTDFTELIARARVAEETSLNEEKPIPVSVERKVRVQCEYCKNIGHKQSECRKLAAAKSSSASSQPNVRAKIEPTSSTLRCYSCNTPGYIKSNCPKCNPKPASTSSSTQLLMQSSADTPSDERPLVGVTIMGISGAAILDSGASNCIVGRRLLEHLEQTNVPRRCATTRITLADGEPQEENIWLYDLDVTIGQRTFTIEFLAVPAHTKAVTLLGANFIKAARILLNVPDGWWMFLDNPTTTFEFCRIPRVPNCATANAIVSSVMLRTNEGCLLEPTQAEELNGVLASHSSVFDTNEEETPYIQHHIKLTCDVPIAVPPYRLSPPKKEYLRAELDRMLAEEIIEESDSPYAAPVVLVPKGEHNFRVCVDYRKLNEITIPDRYPLPRIDDLLHLIQSTKFMTTLDLRAGYHQVAVKPEDRDKTAFITPFGSFRFCRMSFGLRNAPATFQRLMDRFRTGLPTVMMLIYLDDIIIFSDTFTRHLEDLVLVFQRLQEFKLKANRDKCFFCTDSVKYLGHIITPDGITPDPDKISAIQTRKNPSSLKEVMGFVQMCSWFRRFVPNFADVARPLTNLTKKNAEFKWDSPQQEAYDALKKALATSPILRQADPLMPFVLKTDASSYALGACLLQGEDDDQRPVEYASRLLTPAEQNYTTTEREALAIVYAVSKFRGYIECAPVIVETDHQPLRWLMSLRSPSGRLARWALTLQAYDLQIRYISGKSNVVADALSRPPGLGSTHVCPISVDLPHDPSTELRKQQLEDEEIAVIIRQLEEDNANVSARWLDRGYYMNDGVLFRHDLFSEDEEPQLVVPSCLRKEILTECHNNAISGHNGIEKSLFRLRKRYYWSGMRRDITDHIRKCVECQRYKPSNLKPAGLLQTPAPAQRFETLAIDLFGPLLPTEDGYRWVFAVEDTVTKWIELFALAQATAEACARCIIDEVILRHGCPRRVISDNGSQFVSDVMQSVADQFGFKQSLIPAYHPASNPEERRNRDLKTQLAIFCEANHKQWKEALPSIRFAMNSAVHQATGFTPSYLSYGREMRTPDWVRFDVRPIQTSENVVHGLLPYLRRMPDIVRQAQDNIEHSQDYAKKYSDAGKRSGPNYKVGDKVLVNTHCLSSAARGFSSKFVPRRDGPYIVIKKVSPTSFEIADPKEPELPLGKYHVSAMTPFIPAEPTEDPAPVQPLRRRGRPRKQANLTTVYVDPSPILDA
jgi:transposase InsO family protein